MLSAVGRFQHGGASKLLTDNLHQNYQLQSFSKKNYHGDFLFQFEKNSYQKASSRAKMDGIDGVGGSVFARTRRENNKFPNSCQ